MRRSDLAALVAVLLAVALAAVAAPGASERDPAPTPAPQGRTVPVEQATLSCPPLRSSAGGHGRTAAAVLSAPLPGATAQPRGPVRMSAGDEPVGLLHARGRVWSGRTPRIARGVRVDAEGGLAAGLAGAVAVVADDDERGLATASCRRPASHWWFVGVASTAARSGVLHLANPTTGVAVADLTFVGPDGGIQAAGSTGLALAPGERTSVALADLVPGARSLMVEVTARQGRVTAALTEVERDGLEPAGLELVPPAAEPRRTSALTGIPAGGAEHTLSVVNTGDRATVVAVEVLGPRGAYTATALESLRVPAGVVEQTRLPAAMLDADATGIRLTADQPVTAAVRTSAGRPLRDQVYGVAAAPVRLAATPALPGVGGELVLTAPWSRAVTAEVRRLGADGRVLGTRTVGLRGGQTQTVRIGAARRTAALTVRVAGPGRVLAAVRWRRDDPSGTLRSGFPLPPAHVTVRRPAVRYRLAPP